jgi:low temperature requirement protein LtrA
VRPSGAARHRQGQEALRRDDAGTLNERRTSPVELLWDLVFVFAVTQVTALISHHLTWEGAGEGLLVLALIWWAWSAFVWAANATDPDGLTLRVALVVSMVAIFITGLAVPHAFGTDATVFAVSYAFVRFVHLALYADASRRGNASWAAIAGFATTVAIGMALLVVGSLFDGAVRAILWIAAAAIDYAGPAWLTRERLAGLQAVAVAHFAERYGLFIIICLGESIVAIGVGASGHELDFELVAAVTLAVLMVVGMWWTYFDRFAAVAEERLRGHDNPVLAAADGYSYLHLLLVAGIIVFAVGVKVAIAHVSEPLSDGARLCMCGGVALYLVGHAAFRLRMTGSVEVVKLLAAGAVLVVFALTGSADAWVTAIWVTAVLAALTFREAREVASHA